LIIIVNLKLIVLHHDHFKILPATIPRLKYISGKLCKVHYPVYLRNNTLSLFYNKDADMLKIMQI